MLENKKTKVQQVHYSRYVASWRNMGGTYFGDEFEEWLKSEGCDSQEIGEIREMAVMGKLELEMNAKKYIEAYKERLKKLQEEGGEL